MEIYSFKFYLSLLSISHKQTRSADHFRMNQSLEFEAIAFLAKQSHNTLESVNKHLEIKNLPSDEFIPHFIHTFAPLFSNIMSNLLIH